MNPDPDAILEMSGAGRKNRDALIKRADDLLRDQSVERAPRDNPISLSQTIAGAIRQNRLHSDGRNLFWNYLEIRYRQSGVIEERAKEPRQTQSFTPRKSNLPPIPR